MFIVVRKGPHWHSPWLDCSNKHDTRYLGRGVLDPCYAAFSSLVFILKSFSFFSREDELGRISFLQVCNMPLTFVKHGTVTGSQGNFCNLPIKSGLYLTPKASCHTGCIGFQWVPDHLFNVILLKQSRFIECCCDWKWNFCALVRI